MTTRKKAVAEEPTEDVAADDVVVDEAPEDAAAAAPEPVTAALVTAQLNQLAMTMVGSPVNVTGDAIAQAAAPYLPFPEPEAAPEADPAAE